MISVIIPVYNGEKYIKDCINMILQQTYQNFEMIIVNDGSTDKSLEILQTFESVDYRIKIFSFENHGVSWSRNFGISQAQGDFITFIDCDDYIEKDYLENLIKIFSVHKNLDAVFCKVNVINENHEMIKEQFIQNKEYNHKEILNQLLDFRNLNTGPCGKVYVANQIKNVIEFPNIKIYEDLIFNIDFVKEKKRIAFTDKTFYGYVQREGEGAMSSFHKSPSTDIIFAMNYVIQSIHNNQEYDYLFCRIISQVMIYALNCTYGKDKFFMKEVKKFLRQNMYSLMTNKSINKNEKILYMIYSVSCKLSILIRRVLM